MSQPTGFFPWFLPEGKFAGTTRLIIGFIIGALFALITMHYVYVGREAGLLSGNESPAPLGAGVDASNWGAGQPSHSNRASKPFASRMTYELSQVPEELPLPRARAPAAQVASAQAPRVSAAPPVSAAPSREETVPTERVVNARPISAVPPDPRDTTRGMEREARRPEYKEPPKQPNVTSAPVAGRVIEGRDIEVKAVKPPPAPSAPEPKPVEARTVVAARPPLAGVTAIKPPEPAPPQLPAPPRFVVVAPSSAPPSSSGEPVPRDSIAGRLAATRDWLLAAPQTTHTIQLMGASSEEQLKNQLKVLAKSLEPSKIYVFRTIAQGKPSMTVVYGAYDDRRSALQALEKLPPAVAANKPVLRTVNGIRAEMKQHKTDS